MNQYELRISHCLFRCGPLPHLPTHFQERMQETMRLSAFTVAELVTVAVKVTELPDRLGFRFDTKAVAVAKAVTACDTMFDVTPLKLRSPP